MQLTNFSDEVIVTGNDSFLFSFEDWNGAGRFPWGDFTLEKVCSNTEHILQELG